MRVLITGSSGFIGYRIFRKLIHQGHLITCVDRKSGDDARDFFRGNDSHYDLVIHCAAQVGGRRLIETPVAHAENLEIDAALFQWAERTEPDRIVYVSSVAAYPAAYQKWPGARMLDERDIDLEHPQLPDELYGWAKLTGEYLASRSSVPVSIPRLFTVYGEDQDDVFPFGNLVMQLKNYHDPITVWGSGNQVRDFIHVDDVAEGILQMAEQEIDGPVNFCTGKTFSLFDLALKMTQVFPSKLGNYHPEVATIPGPEGLSYRIGKPSRMQEFYTPKITLEEGIRRAL